jgi:hypothetical protein
MVDFPRLRFGDDAQDSRDVRDRLANAIFADADAVETLLFRTLAALTAIHALRHESLIARRQKKARAAATAVVLLATDCGRIIGGNGEGDE